MEVLLAVLTGLFVSWLALVVALALVRPRGGLLVEVVRILPDLLRLIGRLARDRDLPRGARVRLWLLLGYLASPIDLVPDFVPVIGYADDAIVVAATLRAVVRRSGDDALVRHWPGTPDGLAVVRRLCGL